MIIAIDGPSGSGKSTIAKRISAIFNIDHLDTGAMYRMLALKLLKDNKEYSNEILDALNIKIKDNRFYLDDIDVSEEIRKNEVSKLASDISKIKEVREYMVELQRKLSQKRSVVLDGRDIGTVVFPNADLKIYLTASVEIRAKRRYLEDKTLNYEKIYEDIKARDLQDMNRQNSPLKKAQDAIEIDSTNNSIDEVVDIICKLIKERNYDI